MLVLIVESLGNGRVMSRFMLCSIAVVLMLSAPARADDAEDRAGQVLREARRPGDPRREAPWQARGGGEVVVAQQE